MICESSEVPSVDGHERLRLAAREERRAVGARQHAHLARDLPHLVEAAAVEAVAVLEDLALQQLLAQAVVDGRNRGLQIGLLLGERRHVVVLHLLHPGVGLDLALVADGREQRLGERTLDRRHERRVDRLLHERALGLAGLRAQLLLERDDLLDDGVALDERLRHHGLGAPPGRSPRPSRSRPRCPATSRLSWLLALRSAIAGFTTQAPSQ